MMTSKKRGFEIFVLIGIFILLAGSVSAFAVSGQYWKNNPVIIGPGETKDIKLILQNLAGDSDLTVRAEITEGSEIAELIDESNIYQIPLGTKTEVNIRISDPLGGAVESGNYTVKLSFTTLTTTEAGGFGFGNNIEREIPVIIQKPYSPREKGVSGIIYLVVGIVIILVLIIAIAKKKKKR